jgi:hypothetical protein
VAQSVVSVRIRVFMAWRKSKAAASAPCLQALLKSYKQSSCGAASSISGMMVATAKLRHGMRIKHLRQNDVTASVKTNKPSRHQISINLCVVRGVNQAIKRL